MTLALSAFLVALQVLDWHLTGRVLAQDGRELNRLMRFVIEHFGDRGLLVVKIALNVGACGLCVFHHIWWPLAFLNALYLWVCWHNWLQLK